MIKWILKRLALRTMTKRPPDFRIGPELDPYMDRWWFIPRNKYFNIYIHRIYHNDDDRALHDHPWHSLRLCVRTGLGEVYLNEQGVEEVHIIREGQWSYRPATFAHRLTVIPGYIQPAVTVFMTGPIVRKWGFLCPQGWKPWKEFVAPNAKGQQGIGCGEHD